VEARTSNGADRQRNISGPEGEMRDLVCMRRAFGSKSASPCSVLATSVQPSFTLQFVLLVVSGDVQPVWPSSVA
jgi:hypothetical protein